MMTTAHCCGKVVGRLVVYMDHFSHYIVSETLRHDVSRPLASLISNSWLPDGLREASFRPLTRRPRHP